MACIKLYPQEALAGELKKITSPTTFFSKTRLSPFILPHFS